MGYAERCALLDQLEQDRGGEAIIFVTGDRKGLETQIGNDAPDQFVHHLDAIGVVDKLVLYLYTRGGNTLAAWSIINMLQIFCDTLEVIVPAKAQSAGTLICLGADSIVMTKQAALGPIDPSVNQPLNPQVPGASPNTRVPVSVESVNGFIEFARETLGPKADLSAALLHLADEIHPLVLGDAFRARGQIRMLASRLLSRRKSDEEETKRLLEFLCSESGSHDYSINRREARDELKLPIVTPNDAQYALIKSIYDDIAFELELSKPFDPKVLLGGQNTVQYDLPRALIESRKGGSHAFVTAGTMTRQQVQVQPGVVQQGIQDDRQYEGWKQRHAGTP